MNFLGDALKSYESPVCEIYTLDSQNVVCTSPLEPGGGKEELGWDPAMKPDYWGDNEYYF